MEEEYKYFRSDYNKSNSNNNRHNFEASKIPKDSIFVLGDNRYVSFDSRFKGFIKIDNIIGKVEVIYLSIDSNRLGKILNYKGD